MIPGIQNIQSQQNTIYSEQEQALIIKICRETGISSDNLSKFKSTQLDIIDEYSNGFKQAVTIFGLQELAQLDDEIQFCFFLEFFSRLNPQQLEFIQLIHKITTISIVNWIKLFPPENSLMQTGPFDFCMNYSNLIVHLLESKINLDEIVHSIKDIESNFYFADILPENFKILSELIPLSPIQILKWDSKRFVFLIIKAKDIKHRMNQGILDKTLVESFLSLPLADLYQLLPCSSKEWNAIIPFKPLKSCPSSPNKMRKMTYNICPCDLKEGKEFQDVLGGQRKPIFDLFCSVLKNEIENKKTHYIERDFSKIEALNRLLIWVRDFERICYRPDFTRDFRLDRNKGRMEVAIHFLIKKLKEMDLSEKSDDFCIIFPGGWNQHAVMYGIDYNAQTKKYSFSFWNTGDGLQYHHHIADQSAHSDKKYQVRAKWSDLDIEKIAHYSFLESLLTDKCLDFIGDPERTYRKIADHFGKDKDAVEINKSEFHRAQKDKNCGWKSLWAAAADILGREQDPSLALRIKCAIIESLRRDFLMKFPEGNRTTVDDFLAHAIATKEERVKKKIKSLSQEKT